jgi:hypothetical protein
MVMTMLSDDRTTDKRGEARTIPDASSDFFCKAANQDLDRVERVTNITTHEDFFIVRDDTQDSLREYHVHNLLTCTCGEAECSHIQLARAAETELRIALIFLSLQQAQAVLYQSGVKQHDVELAQYTIACAKRDLAAFGIKEQTIEERWNIPAWMMRDPGQCVPIEDDPGLD